MALNTGHTHVSSFSRNTCYASMMDYIPQFPMLCTFCYC
uniref:Uncharacterized protein n=1 Tax=Arundo donax TaxID=35708 RepID=A0A0A9DVV5_ARUDO